MDAEAIRARALRGIAWWLCGTVRRGMAAALAGLLVLSAAPVPDRGTAALAGTSAAPPPYRPSAARVPACAHAGRAIALPRAFPASFPLPPHTALTSQQYRRGGLIVAGITPSSRTDGILVGGIAPTASFMATVRFFARELPRAGFTVVQYEAEPPNDSEMAFKGHGYLGRLVLLGLGDCPAALVLSIFAERS